MFKKLMIVFYTLFLLTPASANQTIAIGNTYITVTNNTHKPIQITPSLTTSDQHFSRGKDWDGDSLILAPYHTEQVLWFSRNTDLQLNQLYQFDLIARNPDYPSDDLTITFLEKGKPVLGSEVSTQLTLPGQTKQTILTDNGLKRLAGEFWGSVHRFYARTWLPLGNVYNNYHFVIDEPENNNVDTKDSQKISVLTYNTQLMPFYADGVDDLNQPKIRVKDIPAKISQYDVVIIEELFDRDLRNTMINGMQPNYPFHTNVVGNNTTKILTGGVMIFSKWPIIREDQTIYQACSGIDCLAAKGVMYAAINKQGKIYHIFGTHLQAGDTNNSRPKQMQEMANFIAKQNIPVEQPVLMGGDFNVNQFEDQLQILLSTLHVSLVDNIGYQYSCDPAVDKMNVGKMATRIDYVFSSDLHLRPKSGFNQVYIMRDLDNESMWPKFDLSDHFPVGSYFEFGE